MGKASQEAEIATKQGCYSFSSTVPSTLVWKCRAALRIRQGICPFDRELRQGHISKGHSLEGSAMDFVWVSSASADGSGGSKVTGEEKVGDLCAVTVGKLMFSCCLQRSNSWLGLPLTGLFTCSLRYTSKGPAVYAIFLTWPRDNILELSSPTPSPATKVRNSDSTSWAHAGCEGPTWLHWWKLSPCTSCSGLLWPPSRSSQHPRFSPG